MMRRSASTALFFLLFTTSVFAQDPLGWNAPQALDLIERARLRRELPRGDSTLQNYQAKANGYVYFYLDRLEDNERTLVKVDQIALNLYWKRPNLTKQRIVGLRDVSRLPNRMYYHLDHLTVVQNNLGNVIKIGDGDEVRDVPHPAAPGADTIYDFRVADSVTLRLGGSQPEVRVYQINVRPKRTDRSAMLGSIYVDRASADIVRMTFTFTPVSYVDRRLDYINISLDNGLFGGKYWLPNEQSVEIRRQLPELDFAAGAVIKGRIRVSDYAFNEPLPDSVFFGRAVSTVPEAERKNYPFPTDIYAGVNEEGLAPPPQMSELREQAAALIGQARLSGLPPWRLYVPNASSVLRHNETEGWYGGLGITYAPSPTFRLDMTGGFAFGAEKPEATIALRNNTGERELTARAYYNEPRDVGVIPGMPGVINTFSSGFGGRDYTDTYFTRGAQLSLARPWRVTWQWRATLRAEQHRGFVEPAPFVAWPRSYSLVPTIGASALDGHNGDALEAALSVRRPANESGTLRWGGNVQLSGIRFAGKLYDYNAANEDVRAALFPRLLLSSELRHDALDRTHSIHARLAGGTMPSRGVPPQYWFYIGGRESLPGYAYRSMYDRSYALGQLELSHNVWSPFVRGRALGYAAYAGSLHGSAGLGVGLLWDVLRVDVVKGAHWQTLVSVRRDFWDML